jgi:hypothetical protein
MKRIEKKERVSKTKIGKIVIRGIRTGGDHV